MDASILLGAPFGVLVTIALTLLGHRQLVQSRDERIRQANREVDAALVERVVSDGYVPTGDEIQCLLGARAFDNRVTADALLGVDDVWTLLIGRVVEHDFIAASERVEILRRLTSARDAELRRVHSPAPSTAYGSERGDGAAPGARYGRSGRGEVALVLATIGLLAAAAGALVALGVSAAVSSATTARLGGAGVVVILLTCIAAAAAPLLLLEMRRGTLRRSEQPVATRPRLGELVRHHVRDLDVAVTEHDVVDFMVEHGGATVLLELRTWGPLPADDSVRTVLDRLSQAVAREQADRGLVVLDKRSRVPSPELTGEYRDVDVVRASELADHLEDMQRPRDDRLPEELADESVVRVDDAVQVTRTVS